MRIVFSLVSFGVIVSIMYLALFSQESLPDHPLIRGYNDLVMHVVAFAVLSLVLSLVLRPGFVLLLSVGLAIAVELAQLFVPGRSTTFADLVASLAGVALGVIIAAGFSRVKRAL